MCGFTYRRVPAVSLMARMVADGRVGTVRHVRAVYLQDWLVDPASSPEAEYAEREETRRRREALAGALNVLKPRERDILEARWLSEPPLRLEQLAARYGVSRERVRQIEMRAFEKVRAAIGGRLAAGS